MMEKGNQFRTEAVGPRANHGLTTITQRSTHGVAAQSVPQLW